MATDKGSQLHSETGSRISIEFDVPMELSDGIILRSNVYRPEGSGPWPVLLTRLPYGKDSPALSGFHEHMLDPVAAAKRGYIVVVQDVRGTFASDGVFDPFRHEYKDGAEAVAWAANLAGSTGAVGMYGGSYFGHTQFAAAVEADGALKTIIPTKRCADPGKGMYFRQGAFELCMQASWYVAMAVPEAMRLRDIEPGNLMAQIRDLAARADSLSDNGYTGRPLTKYPLLRDMPLSDTFFTPIEHPMDNDALSFLDMSRHYDAIKIPGFHVASWYDIFLQQSLDDYMEFKQRGVPSQLIVGPGGHTPGGMNPIGEVNFGVGAQEVAIDLIDSLLDMQLRWMDRWLKDEPFDGEDPAVRIFVMGSNEWRDMTEWPPQAVMTEYFLHSEGALNTSVPYEDEWPDTYSYDPDDPVPTLGGAIMADPGHRAGAFDQRPIEARADVLSFTTEPLDQDLEVIGRVSARLWAITDAVDTDFVIRLCDVYPDGRSINITDGVVRAMYRNSQGNGDSELVEPGRTYEYLIDLWSTANVFKKGHRIRVDVTSSNFPRWDANPNTGNPFASETGVIANQSIIHDTAHPSCVILPVAAAAKR